MIEIENTSETMAELIEIQAALHAPKDQKNTYGNYTYRTCEAIQKAVKPLLKEKKCTLIITDKIHTIEGVQQCYVDDKKQKHYYIGNLVYVEATATITNIKGVSISVKAQAGIDPVTKGQHIAQCFGSSSSYARKYSLNALFLLDDSKEEIDSMQPKTGDAAPPRLTRLQSQFVTMARLSNVPAVKKMAAEITKYDDLKVAKAIEKLKTKLGK